MPQDAAPALPALPEVIDFLLSRRSRPAKLLSGPAPDRTTLTTILAAAARVPDHGKLEPWRFIVIEGAARARLADLARARGAALGVAPDKAAKTAEALAASPVTVALVAVPRPTDKIPEWEQLLSVGAVGLGLVNAALAHGLGACWLTGFSAYDRPFLAEGLGLADTERLAGYIHIGRCDAAPPERPRPDMAQAVRWVSA